MLDAAQETVGFCRGKSLDDVQNDRLLCLALVRLLEVLGEAARSTSGPLQARYPEIPWKQIIGTRDRVAHGYLDIDMGIVYAIVILDLPPLIAHLERAIIRESDGISP